MKPSVAPVVVVSAVAVAVLAAAAALVFATAFVVVRDYALEVAGGLGVVCAGLVVELSRQLFVGVAGDDLRQRPPAALAAMAAGVALAAALTMTVTGTTTDDVLAVCRAAWMIYGSTG